MDIFEALEAEALEELTAQHRGHEAPAGYRWAFGSLERLPEEVPAVVDWEALPARGTDTEAGRRFPGVKQWQPMSPDGLPITGTHSKASAAVRALVEWCKGYRQQRGYRTGRGGFVLYVDLYDECDILPL